MTQQIATSFPARHALPPLSAMVFALAVTVLKWEERRLTRCKLGRLGAQGLDDIGLTARQAQAEAAKPFWRG